MPTLERAIDQNRLRNRRLKRLRSLAAYLTFNYFDFRDIGQGERCEALKAKIVSRINSLKTGK